MGRHGLSDEVRVLREWRPNSRVGQAVTGRL